MRTPVASETPTPWDIAMKRSTFYGLSSTVGRAARQVGRLRAGDRIAGRAHGAANGESGVRDRHQTTSHEIERYAGLFAKRTRQMRSSAMRDLMAITARPEVISLAGGLPDTSTFPPETFGAIMDRIARGVLRERASVRADGGLRGDEELHHRGDGGRGHAGRRRRHDRHDRRAAGDRPRDEDAGRSRATW